MTPEDESNGDGRKDGAEQGPQLRRYRFARGKELWASLEELAESPEIIDLFEREFPPGADEPPPGMDRRRFLQLMGASLALAGITGCGDMGRPAGQGRLLPYVRPPEDFIPGRPVYFATSFLLDGIAYGLLGETHMGRPTKMEGNPQHPGSLGATDTFGQAWVLDLYDPARAKTVTRQGRISDWDSFRTFLIGRREALLGKRGAGLRILTGSMTSPSLISQLQALSAELPEARWHRFDPVGSVHADEGTALAFGRPLHTVLHLDQADVIAAFDADFLSWGAESVRYSHDWAQRRKVREVPPEERAAKGGGMSRLYAAEGLPSLVGAMADHRLRIKPSRVGEVLSSVASALGVLPVKGPSALSEEEDAWVKALATDLRSAQGRSLVLVGEPQPPEVHALAHGLNRFLGNIGKTLHFTEPLGAGAETGSSSRSQSLPELVEDMRAGRVDTLIILDSNPAYTAPASLDFAAALAKVAHTVLVSYYQDETAARCEWHVPLAHGLESWGDARAFDGTVSLIQPLIEPLFFARTPAEVLAVLQGETEANGRELLRNHWSTRLGPDFESAWRDALFLGLIPGTALPPVTVSQSPDWRDRIMPPRTGNPPAFSSGTLEVEFRPDPTVWDGRFTFNVWLQETPKYLSKLTWDNAAYISPRTAERLGLASRDVVELRLRDRMIRAPVWIQPGQCDDLVTVTLGYGRPWPSSRTWVNEGGGMEEPNREGGLKDLYGYNAYAIRPQDAPWSALGLELRKTGETHPLASAQDQFRLMGRPIIRSADFSQLMKNPRFAVEPHHPEASLYPEFAYDSYAWGMTIDMSICTGCSSCVVACRSENNVPVVGKEGMLRGRDMNWLRIDTYFTGEVDHPVTYFQPMLCQQCEKAPCEVVCPVEATLHNGEGLNEMIYNRCIGTRYCSNNCPYKVRRFNFFSYVNEKVESLKMVRNPDVTVRTRGVMEKCTFCVQRINHARIEAKKEDRRIRDGEAITACMQACPTRAITFGDLNGSASLVAGLRKLPWNYQVLGDLNTRPRIHYLAKLWNLNPELGNAMENLPL